MLFLSTTWDSKRQIQFKEIRHNAINVKNTKSDVNVYEMQNPVEFYGRFQTWSEIIQSLFCKSKDCLITLTTEHQKYCVIICIKKQRQSYRSVSQVSKGIVTA